MQLAKSFIALLLVSGSWLGAARAADQPVVAVLYVDNHSGDAAQDVLAKGLADMLVTDLLSQGLSVVERTRLQALIDEQALQKTAFFNPKTAVRVGKGLGASHVVIGALAAMQPELRLDLHLIDVSTGAVVVTAKAQGPGDKLFDLEQTLVERFVTAFERHFAPSAAPQTKVRDVKSLLEYSRGLDLADRGELDAARKKMEETIRLSPGFVLARKQKDELVKRMENSRERRDALILAGKTALAAKARALLAKPSAPEGLVERLAWRNLEMQLLAEEMSTHLSALPFGVAIPGHDKALRAAMVAYAESRLRFVQDLDRARAAVHGWIDPRLPSLDEKQAKDAALETRVEDDASAARRELAMFVLRGEAKAAKDERVTVGPPLAVLDAKWRERAELALSEATELATKNHVDFQVIRTLDEWAEALYLHGRTDEAVAKWQEALDRFPTAPQYDNLERRVKGVLGMERDSATSDLESWNKGLASCDDMPLRVGMDTVLNRRMRLHGIAGIDETIAEVEQACRGNPAADRHLNYLYTHAALRFGKHGYCADFEKRMEQGRQAGASAGDIAGWRQNWTKCPLPAPR